APTALGASGWRSRARDRPPASPHCYTDRRFSLSTLVRGSSGRDEIGHDGAYVVQRHVVNEPEAAQRRGQDERHTAVASLLVVADGPEHGLHIQGGHAHRESEGGQEPLLSLRQLRRSHPQTPG